MVGSSSIALAEGHNVGPFHYLIRHVLFVALGGALAFALMRTELKLIERHNHLLLFGCIALLGLVFFPGIGHTVNGAQRWLNLGVSKFQAVEAVKLLLIIWLASYVVRYRDDIGEKWSTLLKPLGVTGFLVALLLLQPDFGSAALILAITGGMVWLGGARIGHLLLIGAGVLPLLVGSVSAEELGFVGSVGIIAVFAIFSWRTFRLGLRAVEMRRYFAGFCAFGVGLWISLQSFVSIGVNLGLLPTKGLTLPLVSSGGSSVMVTCMAIGLLLRVSYELDRAERQVARLRGGAGLPAEEPAAAPDARRPSQSPAAVASPVGGRDGRGRIEPKIGAVA